MRYVTYNARTWFDTVSKVLDQFDGQKIWFASLVFSKENLHPDIVSKCSYIWDGGDGFGRWASADVLIVDNQDYLTAQSFSFISTYSDITGIPVVIFVQEKRK
jgi:hypothetical protein